MSVIPVDIITNILSQLSVKPLLRFRCVCKSWCTLIDSRNFVQLHLNETKKSKSHRRIIQKGYTFSMYFIDFDIISTTNLADVVPVDDTVEAIGVIGVCDGLVCLANVNGVSIWNPSTRRCQMLPDLDVGPLPTVTFKDSDFLWFSGFGYDVVSDDYKVVFMVQYDTDGFEEELPSEVFVYSMKLDSWRELKPFPYYIKHKRSSGLVAGEAVHWIVGKTQSCEHQWVAAFDLATEEYRIVPQPSYNPIKDFYLYIESLEGCLSIMWGHIGQYVDIWVMKEYGKPESWTKLAKINVSALGDDSLGLLRVLDYSVSQNELILEKDMNSMVRYDIEKKLITNVEIRGQGEERLISRVYNESLLQLKYGVSSAPKKVARNSKKTEKLKKRDNFLSEGFKLVL